MDSIPRFVRERHGIVRRDRRGERIEHHVLDDGVRDHGLLHSGLVACIPLRRLLLPLLLLDIELLGRGTSGVHGGEELLERSPGRDGHRRGRGRVGEEFASTTEGDGVWGLEQDVEREGESAAVRTQAEFEDLTSNRSKKGQT
jgi:hypothetical protein